MRRIVTVMMAMALVGSLVFGAIPSYAAPGWYYATVAQAGITSAGGISIKLVSTKTPPAWDGEKWFSVLAARDKEILAICLTAQTSGLEVYFQVDLASADPRPLITGFYLKSAP